MSKISERKWRKYRRNVLGDKYYKPTRDEVKKARKKAKRERAKAAYKEVRDRTIEAMPTKAQAQAFGVLQRKQRRASRTIHYTACNGILIQVKR